MREQMIENLKSMLRPVVKHRFFWEKRKYAGQRILTPQEGNDLLATMVHKPGAAGKIGGTEMKTCRIYLRNRDPAGNCTRWGVHGKMICIQAGVYPGDNQTLARFCRDYLQTLGGLDYLAVWFQFGEAAARKAYAPNATLGSLTSLEPFYHQRPWTAQLAGKRVVVVSPFAKSIASQYQRRKQVWAKKPEMLPEFNLRTIRCPTSAALSTEPPEYPDWFAGLEAMKKQLEAEPFDVAIIGAGAWSVPLAVHAKSLGAFGIHCGGGTQLIFGVGGGRWEASDEINALRTDAWVRPGADERPKGFRAVENGCYW